VNTATGYLVWVAGSRGPEPQKWPEVLTGMNGKPEPHLALHPLPAALYALPIATLAGLYPPPAMPTVSASEVIRL